MTNHNAVIDAVSRLQYVRGFLERQQQTAWPAENRYNDVLAVVRDGIKNLNAVLNAPKETP